jgi:hypothetical protein
MVTLLAAPSPPVRGATAVLVLQCLLRRLVRRLRKDRRVVRVAAFRADRSRFIQRQALPPLLG